MHNLICPKCKSKNTYRPSVTNSRWQVGSQICKDCDYQGHWISFCTDEMANVMNLSKLQSTIKKDS
jgi:hypothetical protein